MIHPTMSFNELPEAAMYLKDACKGKERYTLNVKVDGFCLIKYKFKNDPDFNSAARLSQMTAGSKQPYQGKITLKQLDPNASRGDITFGMRILEIFKGQLKGHGLPVDLLIDKSGKSSITQATHGFRAVPRKPAEAQNTQAPATRGPTFISAAVYTEVVPRKPAEAQNTQAPATRGPTFISTAVYTEVVEDGSVTAYSNFRKVS
jgi:hypothetical protein